MGLIIAIYTIASWPKAQHLNSTNVSFLTFFFSSRRLPLLLAHNTYAHAHTYTYAHTYIPFMQMHILVEYAYLLMAWPPVKRTTITKKYDITKLVFLWLILSLSHSDWQGLLNSWHTPSFAPIITDTQTFLLLILSLFPGNSVERTHSLPSPCFPLFWIIHTFSLHSQNKNSCAKGVWCSLLSGDTSCARAGIVVQEPDLFKQSYCQATLWLLQAFLLLRMELPCPAYSHFLLSASIGSQQQRWTPAADPVCPEAGGWTCLFSRFLLLRVALPCPVSEGCWGTWEPQDHYGPFIVAGHSISGEVQNQRDFTWFNRELNFVKENGDFCNFSPELSTLTWSCLAWMPSHCICRTARQSQVEGRGTGPGSGTGPQRV